MARYRKKPVVIEASRFKGFAGMGFPQFEGGVPPWIAENVSTDYGKTGNIKGDGIHPWLLIETLEGTMRADPGDWIIRGVKGELYPVKNDVFELTYEAVE